MKRLLTNVMVMVLFPVLPDVAAAQASTACSAAIVKGRYVFTATGYTRPANSVPGAPWTPKAIVELLAFNGEGSVTTPAVTVANPFGDTGGILQPPAGAPGAYIVNEDCTGRIHFFDVNGVMFNIVVDARGDTIHLIQTNPSNNVFQGSARRMP